MEKVKIAVVEDEVIIADNICDLLEVLGYETIEPAISYSEALEMVERNKPDLIILDIQLAGKKDGIDLAWKIKEDYNIPFIFLTSNADKLTVERAKKVAPPAYLIKPFNKDELYTSIEIALYNHAQEKEENIIIKDAVFIKQKQVFNKVLLSDIAFIKSDHVYVEIHTIDQKVYVVRGSLNDYTHGFSEKFIRIHRSYVINSEHLSTINYSYVTLGANTDNIPIGKSYREELISKIKIS